MTWSGFTTNQSEILFGEGSRPSQSGSHATREQRAANLRGRANLTPDEYLILFGDSAVADSGEPVTQSVDLGGRWVRLKRLAAHPYFYAGVLVLSVLVGAAIARGLLT